MASTREKRKKPAGSSSTAITGTKRPRGRSYGLRSEDVYERRIQSLARLLQGASECVAVAVIDNQCLIAANELKKTSRTSNTYCRTISQVMDYFKNVYQTGSTLAGEEKLQWLNQIFTPQCKKSTKGAVQISDKVIALVIAQVIDGSCSDEHLLQLYRNDHAAAGFVLGQFEKFYTDFCKVEQSVSTSLAKVFSSDYHILRESAGPDEIHAEAQLLEKILKDKLYETAEPLKIELGISKLCCAHCCELLSAANEVFERNTMPVKVVFAGRHDLDFKKWSPPQFFRAGFNSETSSAGTLSPSTSSLDAHIEIDEDHLAYEIATLAKQRIALVLAQQAPSGVLQVASVSSSEPEQTAEERLRENQQSLESMKKTLESLPFDGKDINLELINMGLRLADYTAYKELFRKEYFSEDLNDLIETLILQLGPTFSKDMLISYLSTDCFVGVNVAKHFKPLLSSTSSQSSSVSFFNQTECNNQIEENCDNKGAVNKT